MPTKPLDRLMFIQGGLCFFCKHPLSQADASVEHLVASANGGGNSDDNCVACCKALNAMFGRMSLKEKVALVLNQKGHFKCPNKKGVRKPSVSDAVLRPTNLDVSTALNERLARVIADLEKRRPSRPATVKRLSSTISALFQKQITAEEVSSLIERLRADGLIVISGMKVSYQPATKVRDSALEG